MLPEEFLGNLLSFLGRYFSKSGSLNLVQSRETIQSLRQGLKKNCCPTLAWRCSKRQWNWYFSWPYQPVGSRHVYAITGKVFAFSWYKLVCGRLWLVGKFLQKRRKFFIIGVNTRLLYKAICTSTSKQHICWLLVPKRNLQNVAARFTLEIIVTVFIIIFPRINIDTILL